MVRLSLNEKNGEKPMETDAKTSLAFLFRSRRFSPEPRLCAPGLRSEGKEGEAEVRMRRGTPAPGGASLPGPGPSGRQAGRASGKGGFPAPQGKGRLASGRTDACSPAGPGRYECPEPPGNPLFFPGPRFGSGGRKASQLCGAALAPRAGGRAGGRRDPGRPRRGGAGSVNGGGGPRSANGGGGAVH